MAQIKIYVLSFLRSIEFIIYYIKHLSTLIIAIGEILIEFCRGASLPTLPRIDRSSVYWAEARGERVPFPYIIIIFIFSRRRRVASQLAPAASNRRRKQPNGTMTSGPNFSSPFNTPVACGRWRQILSTTQMVGYIRHGFSASGEVIHIGTWFSLRASQSFFVLCRLMVLVLSATDCSLLLTRHLFLTASLHTP